MIFFPTYFTNYYSFLFLFLSLLCSSYLPFTLLVNVSQSSTTRKENMRLELHSLGYYADEECEVESKKEAACKK